jgi:hypothetical protein
MSKLIFLPVSILSGLISGLIGKRLFAGIWRLIDKEEPPRAEQQHVDLRKFALALVIEGALFRAVKGLVDHASRESFAKVTGTWPGESDAPQAE